MEQLREILKNHLEKFVLDDKPRRHGNPLYGIACDLQRNLSLPLSMCFRLLKKHTPQELGSLVSWWKDYPYKRENNIGLLYWKLKSLYPNKYVKK